MGGMAEKSSVDSPGVTVDADGDWEATVPHAVTETTSMLSSKSRDRIFFILFSFLFFW